MGGFVLALLSTLTLLWSESRWYPDVKEGFETAKIKEKLVLLYFYEEGCSYCRYMETVVFVDPEVSSLMDRAFVVVPVDTENIPRELDRRFRVFGTPTFIIYDPLRDRIIMEIFGMQESDEFLDLLKRACSKGKVKSC